MESMLDVTGIDLKKLVQDAYDLSAPQGMGILHFKEGGLPESVAADLVSSKREDGRIALALDYIKGRACKLTVLREGEKLFLNPRWYDHTNAQFEELLRRQGIIHKPKSSHSISCNCSACQTR